MNNSRISISMASDRRRLKLRLKKLQETYQSLGKDPEIETRVDPTILGGLKVKVGSRLYDASLKTRLDQLKFALKRA